MVAVPDQLTIDCAPLPEVPLPRTVADCRQRPVKDENGEWVGGTCPKFSCEFNVVLHITRSERRPRGNDPGRSTETINIGGRGGHGKGDSLAARRTCRGKVKSDIGTTKMADRAVELCDRLPSTCVLDYVENPELIESSSDADDCDMTLEQVGAVLEVSREAVRKIQDTGFQKARHASGFDEWAELVRMKAALRNEPPAPPTSKRGEFHELDIALDRALERIREEKLKRAGLSTS